MKIAVKQERVYTLELTERELQVLYKGHGNMSEYAWGHYAKLDQNEYYVMAGLFHNLEDFFRANE